METETSCDQLIQKFREIGGSIHCSYIKKKMYLKPLELSCRIEKSKDSANIDMLLMEFSSYGNNTKINQMHKIDKIHLYQEDNISGFTINIDINKDGFYISPR